MIPGMGRVLGRRPRALGRVCVAGFCSVVAVCVGGAGGAVAASWTIVPAPGAGALNSVSCTSWSACTAVGVLGTPVYGPGQVLAERWNGRAWSVEPLTPPAGGQSEFTDVSCGSPRFCVADGLLVYGSTSSSLLGTWNGSRWSIRKLRRGLSGGALSCTSRRFCVMVEGCTARWCLKVGSRPEAWNGARWSPMPDAQRLSRHFETVSCVAATSCVGIAGMGSVRWNGSRWSALAPLDPSPILPYASVRFGPMSCSSARACTVVASQSQPCDCYPNSFVERWNGARWLAQPTPAESEAVLSDVACTARKDCTIVGGQSSVETPPPPGEFAERWNGVSWSIQPIAAPVGATMYGLQGVACVAARCMAVGSWSPNEPGHDHTLVEQYG